MFCLCLFFFVVFFFKQKTAYEMRISDWSSDVCSSDLCGGLAGAVAPQQGHHLAFADVEGDAVQHMALAVPAFEAGDRQQGLAAGGGRRPLRRRGRLRHAPLRCRLRSLRDPARPSRSLLAPAPCRVSMARTRSEEHTSELQSLMRLSYAV